MPAFTPAIQAAPEARLQIEAYCRPEFDDRALFYRLHAAPPADGVTAAEIAEAAAAVREALAGRGMLEAPDGVAPSLEISIDLSVRERAEPESPYSRRFRPVTHRVRTVEVPVEDASGNVQRVQQRIILPAKDGYVAWRSARPTITVFEKSLVLAARERPARASTPAPREAWRVVVRNKDDNGDLLRYVPVMVAAATDRIASRTDGREEILVPLER